MGEHRVLSSAHVTQYRDDGFASPIRVMPREEAMAYRAKLEAFEQRQGFALNGNQRAKTYLLFSWAYELLTHPRILDAVEDLVGPDILAYHWTTWIKEPRSPGFVSWHQDSTYFGLEPLEEVTVWLALSEANSESGCMRALPGSHRHGQLPSEMKPDENNLLTSGQTVQFSFDELDTVAMPLEPGEMSMHNTCTVHGSGGNNGADRRIGFCMSFIPAHVRPIQHLIEQDAISSAMLVRGKCQHDLFPDETPPAGDADPISAERHRVGVERYRRMVKALGHMTAERFD